MTSGMTLYLFYTWLLANLLHPLIIWTGLHFTHSDLAETINAGSVVIGFGISCLLSIPVLILASLGLKIIVSAKQELFASLFVWIITVAGSIIFEVLVSMVLFTSLEVSVLSLFIPAMIASAIAILIRHKQFSKLIVQHEIK